MKKRRNNERRQDENELKEFEALAKEVESLREPKEETKEEPVKVQKRNFMAKVVHIDHLRIRQAPNQSAPVIGLINRGDIVKIVPSDDGNSSFDFGPEKEFYQIITATGVEGFCMNQFLLTFEENSFEEV